MQPASDLRVPANTSGFPEAALVLVRRIRDRLTLDALAAMRPSPYTGITFRVTLAGLDPTDGSSDGRWSPGEGREVLYTSLSPEDAIAEVGERLDEEPVVPSKTSHEIHALSVRLRRTLHLASMKKLAALGIEPRTFNTDDYTETQTVAAAAYQLNCDGLLVPCAPQSGTNLVIFIDRLGSEGNVEAVSKERVDWDAWRDRTAVPLPRGTRAGNRR